MKRSNSTASELNDFVENAEGKKEYNVSTTRITKLINWVGVFKTFLPIAGFVVVGVLIFQIGTIIFHSRVDLKDFFSHDVLELQKPVALDLGWKTMALLALGIFYLLYRDKPVYLLDFTTFEPPESWKLSQSEVMEILRLEGCFSEESLAFQERMLAQSGVGPATAWPPGIVKVLRDGVAAPDPDREGKPLRPNLEPGAQKGLNPRDFSAEAARRESEVVIFDCVRRLLNRTKVKARDIDILVINCSLFSPTPSLCSMVVNEFKMKADVCSYNLSGMGCSAGVVSIELVKNLLRAKPNSLALVVSTENLTQALYTGNNRSFLLQNTLFRVGGAAVLLSNRWQDAFRAQLKLLHVVRTQYVTEDSYGCVYETEDDEANRGVRLSKDLVKVAGRALEKNLTSVGPLVLPFSEQAGVARSIVANMLRRTCNRLFGTKFEKQKAYMPDFKRGLDHFCIHAGGRGVIDSVEKNLALQPYHVAASRHALRNYGNTSSSSIWYEMDFLRRNAGGSTHTLSRGERVLQIAFGSGFKCNSAVWLCINAGNYAASSEDDEKDKRKKD